MADCKRGKRKNPCSDFISGIDEIDLSSPENSTSDLLEPDKKVSKTDNNISVVTTESSNKTNPTSGSASTNKSKKQVVRIHVDVCNESSEKSQKSIVDEVVEVKSRDSSDVECLEEGEVQDMTDKVDISIKEPSITIKFSDEKIADSYKSKLIKFLESFVELNFLESNDPLTLSLERDFSLDEDWVVVDATPAKLPDVVVPQEEPKIPPKKKKKKKPKKELFVLDTNPSLRSANSELRYSSKFVIEDKVVSDGSEIKVSASAQSCFNCGQNHPLRDCPLPKDHVKIRNARLKHANTYQNKPSRYHLEEDQKYGHMTPGKISNELRKALGLRNNELPQYIYRMRSLGYPPGWLEEAKFIHSNLDMFDIHGNNVRHSLKKKQGLDPEKIINYPGFNVPLEKGYKDDYRRFDVPPYSDRFNKQVMLEYFEKEFAKNQDDFETCDMDVDNDEHTDDNNEDNMRDKYLKRGIPLRLSERLGNSPSLTDLEKQKLDLLAELNDSVSSKPGTPSVEETKSLSENLVSEVSEDKSTCDENSQESGRNNPPSTENCDSNNSSNEICGKDVKGTAFGTPILKSSSPYTKLPNPDNFMKDVSPVINFENLPNSTGKYEQMTGVLQKVRKTLKNLQHFKT